MESWGSDGCEWCFDLIKRLVQRFDGDPQMGGEEVNVQTYAFY